MRLENSLGRMAISLRYSQIQGSWQGQAQVWANFSCTLASLLEGATALFQTFSPLFVSSHGALARETLNRLLVPGQAQLIQNAGVFQGGGVLHHRLALGEGPQQAAHDFA